MSCYLRVIAGAIVVFAAAPAPSATAQNASARGASSDRLRLDHYLQWEGVAGPLLSPDGSQIIYTRRYIDPINDRWSSALWIMNADGKRDRFFLDGSSPRWSSDGKRVAFMAPGEPRGNQVFIREMDVEGSTSQISRLAGGISDLTWSPDGQWFAFRMRTPGRTDGAWRIDMPARPEGARWSEPPRIVEKLQYRRDRQGFVPDGYQQIFLMRASGGPPRQLTSGDWDHSAPMWMPDGRRILFTSNRVENADSIPQESEIYAVDIASGEIRQLTQRRGPDTGPVPSPDGRLIAYTGHDATDDRYIESTLYVMNADGSNVRVLTQELDRSPDIITWAPDGRGIYFGATSEGTRNLYFVPLNGAVRRITQGDHMLSVDAIASNGLAVGTVTSVHEPGALVTFRVDRPQLQTLIGTNRTLLEQVRLGEVEEIWYGSADDFRIHGWIMKPPDFDPARKYPLILVIHGGPTGMYSTAFNFAWQVHAADGYVVLYTNPRGSSGYGSAFGNAIKFDYPNRDYLDVMAGVDTVVNRGYIDERNMFVYGGSYGGTMAAWIVGHTDRFAAASVNYPVINWLSLVGTTDGTGAYRNFSTLPWDDASEHLRRSPLMYVGNVKTPTLLMTGVNDLRTPISQTEEFYQALKYRGVPTAMIRFNDEYHGTTSRVSNFLRTQLYLKNWFERWANRAPRAESDGPRQ